MQGEGLNDSEYIECVRNRLGKTYFLFYSYTLAMGKIQGIANLR